MCNVDRSRALARSPFCPSSAGALMCAIHLRLYFQPVGAALTVQIAILPALMRTVRAMCVEPSKQHCQALRVRLLPSLSFLLRACHRHSHAALLQLEHERDCVAYGCRFGALLCLSRMHHALHRTVLCRPCTRALWLASSDLTAHPSSRNYRARRPSSDPQPRASLHLMARPPASLSCAS